jgi:uncharacterized membrane protein YjgN (DUF898 family)
MYLAFIVSTRHSQTFTGVITVLRMRWSWRKSCTYSEECCEYRQQFTFASLLMNAGYSLILLPVMTVHHSRNRAEMETRKRSRVISLSTYYGYTRVHLSASTVPTTKLCCSLSHRIASHHCIARIGRLPFHTQRLRGHPRLRVDGHHFCLPDCLRGQ